MMRTRFIPSLVVPAAILVAGVAALDERMPRGPGLWLALALALLARELDVMRGRVSRATRGDARVVRLSEDTATPLTVVRGRAADHDDHVAF